MTPQMKGAVVAVLVVSPLTAAMTATIGPEALLPAVTVLLVAQRASAIKRRKEVWEAMHPNSGATCADIPDRGPGRPREFASETADVAGESKSQINRHVSRAEALGDDLEGSR